VALYIRVLFYSIIILLLYVIMYNKGALIFPESVLTFFIIISISQYFINKVYLRVNDDNKYLIYLRNLNILHCLSLCLLISLYKILINYKVIDLVLNFDISNDNLIIECLRFIILFIYLIITIFYYNDYRKSIQGNAVKDIMFYLLIIFTINIFYVKNLIFFYI